MRKPPSGAPDRRAAPRPLRRARRSAIARRDRAWSLLVVRPTPGAVRGRVADVRDWVDSIGPLAPLAFIAVSAPLTPLMFPGPLLAGASGLLFGTALGFPVSLASAVLGASLAFVISRYVAPRRGRAARRAAAEGDRGAREPARLRVGALRADRARRAVHARQLRGGADADPARGVRGRDRARHRAARVRLHGAGRLARQPAIAGGGDRGCRAGGDGARSGWRCSTASARRAA